MLACVCLNPSFDRTVSLCSFTAGDVNRVLSARQDVGGKGINVAITARRLGIASCVLGCAGKNGIDADTLWKAGGEYSYKDIPQVQNNAYSFL